MKFSLLMSIYHKEKATYFQESMTSIWDIQTVKPNEIVLVQDGQLTKELYDVINQWKNKLGDILKVVILEKNLGLGDALNIGLHQCSHELIARMDTDDIASEDRFEKQLQVFKTHDIDVCGSWVSEFEQNEKNIISHRKVPKSHEDIVRFGKKRNPLNHPSVMYKKSSVQSSGGYQTMLWFEDYFLWVRMIISGSKFYNIQESLVNMRAGNDLIKRRTGIQYAIKEFKFQQELLKLNYFSFTQFLQNILIRFSTRIVPKYFVNIIYKLMRY